MRKPADVRAYLTRCNAFLQRNPDRLQVFVEKGRIVCNGTRNLSHEYRYTLTLVITDYTDSEDEIMLPLLGWLRVNQPELFENPSRWDTAFQFEVELLNNAAQDIEIQLALTESVIVRTDPDGKQRAEHVGEPVHPDIPSEDMAIDVVLPEGLGTVEVRVPAWRHPYE
ncbi:phage tail protein [Achromobacter anxifer]|uniref:phage tail protein n=1 Tax=Achromobacter anxifer TaxID=1287737 RepID=UPI0023FA0CA1|nr:phage tail protein [Achromobacter anxifer]MDF8362018.1 phage tail protein [Achromobacter anxifer]